MTTTPSCRTANTAHWQAPTEVGYDHAAFTDADGGDPHVEPDVPDRFADIPTYYTAAYVDGLDAK